MTDAAEQMHALSIAIADGRAQRVESAAACVCRAVIEDHLVAGLSADYLRGIASALGGLPEDCLPERRAIALIHVGQYQYNIGCFEPVATVERALELAQASGDRVALRKALTAVGLVCADIGDLPRATECYADALDIASAMQDREGQLNLHHNIGVMFSYAGLLQEAMASYQQVIAATDESDPMYYHAHMSLGFACFHMGEYERAMKALETSRRFATRPLPGDLSNVALRETYHARIYMELGTPLLARQHLDEARRLAGRAGSLRARHMVDVAEGLYLVMTGKPQEGIAVLTEALEQARSHMPVMLRNCLRALTRAYDVSGLPQQAIGHLQELIQMVRQGQSEIVLWTLRRHFPMLDNQAHAGSAYAVRLRGEEAALRSKMSRQELFRSPMEMLERMAVAAELRDDPGGGHCHRVGKLSALLANELGWERRDIDRIDLAARLHDIGKIGVPDEVILKRGALGEAERELMRAHTRVGADLLEKSNIPGIAMAIDVALHHHDRWDGGRGEGVRGDDIPVAARIVALAEVFDALTHARPHRAAWSVRQALEEIDRLKGSQFDPALADAFIGLVKRIAAEQHDLDAFLGAEARSSGFLRARERVFDSLKERQPA